MVAVPSPQPSPQQHHLSSTSTSTSKFLIAVSTIIAFTVVASVSFNLLRRLISHRRSSSPPPTFCRPSFPNIENTTSTPPTPDRNPTSVPQKPPDCAVCLSPFRPSDHLRLLPSCRHAFHIQCIDLWLQSTPSCPLCRSPASPAAENYEVSCGFDDEEVKEEGGEGGEEAEIREESRGWLRDYLDRMASSASTSFNSLAFSGSGRLSSRRFDSGSLESVAAGDGRSWDVEGVAWVEEAGLAGIYRWFMGI